jgi:hypothetical protein
MNAALVLRGMLTCPECCQRTIETMPLNACIWFYDCPPMQQARDCCRPAS